MAFKDALQQATQIKTSRCRICAIISDLPEPDAGDLAAASRQGSGVKLKDVVAALEIEGFGDDLFNAARHHRYSCPNA